MTSVDLPRLLVLTDRSQLRLGRGLLRTLAECRDAGLTHVVLRELDEPPAQRAAVARAAADLGLVVIAAHVPLPRAAGIHLPSDAAVPVGRAGGGRAVLAGRAGKPPAAERVETNTAVVRGDRVGLDTPPPSGSGGSTSGGSCFEVDRTGGGGCFGVGVAGGGGVRGRSCHARAEVEQAAAEGFDYVTLSPYAATVSKPGYGPPLSPGALRGHAIPVYALGGVTTDNAARAVADGAHGVAVMGEVMRAAEPAQVVHDLLAVLPPADGARADGAWAGQGWAGAPAEGEPGGRKEDSFHRRRPGAEGKFLPPTRGGGFLPPEPKALDGPALDGPALDGPARGGPDSTDSVAEPIAAAVSVTWTTPRGDR